MLDKMKQMMEMKKQADQVKRELDGMTVEVEEVRGIKITLTASQSFRTVEISEDVLSRGDKSRLENDLLRSINTAIKKSQQVAAQKMGALMQGL